MFKKKFFVSIVLLILVFFLTGCGLKEQEGVSYEVSLEIWGLFDDRDAYNEIFDQYKKLNPQIKQIEYRKLSADTYKNDILEALAAGQGPDILLIQNTWLPSFQDKLISSPSDLVSAKNVSNEFVDTVSNDFVSQNKVFALPLSVDSLALFYNKDILNRVGITSPPTSWDDFLKDVEIMTQVDSFGNIIQSGAALGSAYNINRSTDILEALFYQNDVAKSNPETVFSFNLLDSQAEKTLNFYTQFSSSSFPYYSWNPRMHYSLDAFSEGNLAMMLNYSWQIQAIKSKSPKLNFAIAPLPQVDEGDKVTLANYWGYGVVKNKIIDAEEVSSGKRFPTQEERIYESWKFIKFLTFSPESSGLATLSTFDPAKDYLNNTEKPAARRDLIDEQSSDFNLGVFALGNLYAKAPFMIDAGAIETILAEAIDKVVKGTATSQEALTTAQGKINKLISK